MSKIERWDQYDGQMLRDSSGLWVRYEDHRAEIEGLNADLRDRNRVRIECNAAQIEATRLRTTLAEADGTIDGLRTELAEQDRKLETAQAEVERLAQELEGRRATNQRVIAERDADTGRNHLRKVVELFETHFADDPSGKYRPLAYPFYEAAVKQVAVALEAAQAESERLRADAERYQWLRNSQTHKSVGCIEFGVWGVLLNGPELDAAVDRGMQASANESGRDE